jgi:tetratricopeptide (TPR) repeat protein
MLPDLHRALGLLATAAGAVLLLARVSASRRSVPALSLAAAAALLLVLAPLLLAARAPDALPRYDADACYAQLTATNARQAGRAGFPAGARLATAAEEEGCATGGCHPLERAAWERSRHAHAGQSPYYHAAAAAFGSGSWDPQARWCQGCHGARKAQTGVGCLGCHAIRAVPSLAGNGQCLREPASAPILAESRAPWAAWLRGLVVRLRPESHRRAFSPPELASKSEFCAPCHRMGLTVAQNRYKFLRAQDEYGTWQASFVSGHSTHDFYPPAARPQSCQSCHMPPGGPGVDHSCPASSRSFKLAVTVDLISARIATRRTGAAEEVAPFAPAASAPEAATAVPFAPGDELVVNVVVTNRGVGHEFPAGISDAKDVWIEFEARDGGRPGTPPFFRSGGLQAKGEVDSKAHRYGLVALDRDGRLIRRNNLHEMVTPLYRRSLGPGEADVVRYRLHLPPGLRGPLLLRARLNHRSVNPEFHGAAFPGQAVPLPPVRVLCEARAALVPGRPLIAPPAPGDADRFYQYGVGLLLQADLPRAAAAMVRVQALAPGEARGYLGLGRVYLQEGDLLSARTQFEKAQQLAGRSAGTDPRPAAFLGTVYRRTGEYERALSILEPLARRFPQDRALWFDIGMSHYRLEGHDEQAAAAFRRILEIDPDDVGAHYNLMLTLQRLNRLPEARREETIYRYLKEDETVRRIIGTYLHNHADADREFQTIHEHG